MSWFFGKKKHQRESPPDTSDESIPTVTNSGEYLIVEKNENPQSPTTSGGLYPYLGDRPVGSMPYPPVPQQQQYQSSDNTSYLSGIPFKFNKTLDSNFEIERLKIDEITSFVHRIINEDYDYHFNLERSIINEMDSEIE